MKILEAFGDIYVVSKNGSLVSQSSDGDVFTKDFDKAMKFTKLSLASQFAKDCGKRYGSGYRAAKL